MRETWDYSSQGRVYSFLDADDFWDSSKISKQVNILSSSSVDLVYTGVTLVASDGVEIIGTINPDYQGDCSSHFRRYPAKAIVTLGASNALLEKNYWHNPEFWTQNFPLAQIGIFSPVLRLREGRNFGESINLL